MSLRLGDKAPNFQAKTSIGDIDFYEYLGDSWGILFSHPADYTPVCTTELGRTAALKDEFAKRNVKVLALSVDPLDKHLGWIKDINETQKVSVEFPIIADDDRKVSTLYEFIHPNASATATRGESPAGPWIFRRPTSLLPWSANDSTNVDNNYLNSRESHRRG